MLDGPRKQESVPRRSADGFSEWTVGFLALYWRRGVGFADKNLIQNLAAVGRHFKPPLLLNGPDCLSLSICRLKNDFLTMIFFLK